MGNNLCAPWKKPYIEDEHWTPRKDSHLLRLWAEIFEVQEANGDICWSRVSDDVVPVNITCIQNHPITVFHITAYNRHVEKIFDVRLVQPGTRITQASECFAHWKDSKCDHEWGLNFTTPLDARRFHDCCMGSSKQNWRKAASSSSLGLSPPQKIQCRKSSSNPTSPVTHSRPASSALDEFLVEDAIEAGFLLPGRDKPFNELPADISSESVRQKTCQLACENIYTRLSHNLSSCTSYNHKNNSLAEREVYSTLVSTNRHNWPTKTPCIECGAGKCNEEHCVQRHKPTIISQELRQFSREPSTLSICKMKSHNHISRDDDDSHRHDALRETKSSFKVPTYRNTVINYADDANCTHEQCEIYAETKREQSGFDSNTLKRLLQTLPNAGQKANAQECRCPISKSLGASFQMNSDHHKSHSETQNMEAYLSNDGKMLQYNDVDIKLQTVDQQQLNNLDMRMERRGSDLNEFGDDKVNEDIDILPYRLQQPFCGRSTAIRKTGFLFVQNWLLNKIVTVVQSPQQSWRQYWTCLKGTALLLYDFENSDQRQKHPTHVIVISGCLAHPHSEHTGCENTFSISTIFGWAYLFKTSSKAEMNSWIRNIHLACAASFARHLGKKSTIKLLSSEIHKLENSIDLDLKMKKMASMQIHTVNDPVNRDILNRQIVSWDENLEKLFVEQYQLRCYLSALQGSDLPCAKMLLSNMSDATKASFKVLTPVAYHTVICARLPVTATETFSHFPKNQDHCLLSTFKADNSNKLLHKAPRTINLQSRNCSDNVDVVEDSTNTNDQVIALRNVLLSVSLPRNQTLVVEMNDKTTVEDLLTRLCNRCHLNSSTHFIRVKGNDNKFHRIPDKTDLVLLEEGEILEVCAKVLFQAEIFRNKKEQDFGFSIEAKSSGDSKQDLSVYISDIGKGIITGSKKGLHIGDELIVLNSLMVSELDMVYIETTLEECESISLTVRSCRSVDQLCEIQTEHAEALDCVESSTHLWQRNELHGIDRGDDHQFSCLKDEHSTNSLRTSDLLLPQLHLQEEDSSNAMETESFMNSLSDHKQCHEVIVELIETERHYVKDLNCFIESYLEPLKRGTFLPDAVIERLFGNIKEILKFQQIFLRSIENAVNDDGLTQEYSLPTKKSLFSLGSAFLYYAHHFKLYSSFCASHSKAKKILLSENISFQEFFRLQNVTQQQSASLESYLVKPIRRFIKYTQLLRRLVDLTNQQSEECAHLKEALHGMEAVAEHINEMQKIYEEYGGILDEMMKDYRDTHPQENDVDLNVGELQMYGTVNWLNAMDEICKVNNEMELLTLLFIFKSGVVLVAQECLKGKRKAEHGRPSLCGETIESARIKIFIPVEQLQVRTMVGDAYECHGVWEMVQCRSEIDDQSDKIFQFASSQEARRDFIRTIQQTILHSVNRISITANDRKELFDVLPCHYSNIDNKTAHHNSPIISERLESLLVEPVTDSPNRFSNIESVMLKDNCPCKTSDNCNDGTELRESVCKVQSDNEAILGSQSTLTSERAGARLVHASHSSTACSNQNESTDPIGSPIWKPRHGVKHSETVNLKTLSEDGYIEHHIIVENKQKVAFRIPHSKGTDC